MLNSKPLISVITVVFNSRDAVFETLKSVVSQKCDCFEYIVVDGGSVDGTLDVLHDHRDFIDVLISEPDSGIYDAMNKGAKLASGKWLNFMNAGDTFYNDLVLVNVLDYLDGDIVYGSHSNKGHDEDIVQAKINNYAWQERNIPYCHQSAFIKRDVFNEALYDTRFKLASDYAQYLFCKSKGMEIRRIPIVVASFLPGGAAHSNTARLAEEYHEIMKKYWPFWSLVFYIYRVFVLKILKG
ncbi:glycosyltransferase [Marinobacter alexandrii]|uniref:glycosyltransferase family 2 protein n=1 Tax=Marinobacter alexandrii TaxID=2570351 RepID=UPI001FFF893B|nr:glycosyltransferase family 2 protein [Marinobacter alexandrii]MCK2150070.1 glycosyltransferase [Marinobacter alexandrii]